MPTPTGAQVIAYAETFKGVAKGRTGENVNTFTKWYYGNNTSASFCLIGICYVFDHFGALAAFLGGKIAYVPDLKRRVGSKWHTDRKLIAEGDLVAFDFNRSGEPEHVGLFKKWANSAHTQFVSFEFNTTGAGSDDYCGEKTRNWSDVFGFVKPGLAADDPGKYTGTIYRYVKGKALMSGSHVKWIQQRLAAHGRAVTVDSEYGPKTAMAVKGFQKDAHLVQDGEVGAKTWAALAK